MPKPTPVRVMTSSSGAQIWGEILMCAHVAREHRGAVCVLRVTEANAPHFDNYQFDGRVLDVQPGQLVIAEIDTSILLTIVGHSLPEATVGHVAGMYSFAKSIDAVPCLWVDCVNAGIYEPIQPAQGVCLSVIRRSRTEGN